MDYRKQLPERLRPELDELVSGLKEQRLERAGKKDYDLLVYPYFAQMTSVLKECKRCLKVDGPIHIMVSDAAFYGIHVSSPQILGEIMEDIGFRNVKCDLVRKRGHRWILDKRDGSPTGLGEYHLSALK
jgi:DNA modification methylase